GRRGRRAVLEPGRRGRLRGQRARRPFRDHDAARHDEQREGGDPVKRAGHGVGRREPLPEADSAARPPIRHGGSAVYCRVSRGTTGLGRMAPKPGRGFGLPPRGRSSPKRGQGFASTTNCGPAQTVRVSMKTGAPVALFRLNAAIVFDSSLARTNRVPSSEIAKLEGPTPRLSTTPFGSMSSSSPFDTEIAKVASVPFASLSSWLVT